MVKQHPRSPDDPFKARGIVTVASGNIPWEVILMNEDFSGKTLLAVASGTALAPALYHYEPIQTYLLFWCVHHLPELDRPYLDYVREIGEMGWLTIPENEGDFFARLAAREDINIEKERKIDS